MKTNVTRALDTKPQYKKDRILYILQATVEYFITIAVGTTYLAKVAIEIGMSDATIALLTQIIHFSFVFQLIAIPLNKFKHPKRWVTPSLILIELAFTLVYLVPLLPAESGIRPLLLVVAVVLGNALHNINSSAKSAWMIGFVADDKRGSFTSLMQIASLIGGIAFSYILGNVIDAYEMRGDMRGAFIVGGILVAALSVIHVIIFLFTTEIENEGLVNVSVLSQVKSILTDKNVMKIIPIYLLYYAAMMCATPFYSTYQIKELGFTMSYIALLSALGAVSRSVFSIVAGKLGDKYGFLKVLNMAYIIIAISFLINMFTVPSNGKVFYAIYIFIHCMGMAGVGVSDVNIIYDYASIDKRVGVIAIRGTATGIVSFVVTLLMGRLVSHIQESGNRFLGMNVYAQQVGSAMAFIGFILLIIYVNTVAKSAKRYRDVQSK